MQVSFSSPDSLLASFITQAQYGRVVLITGASGSGKTSWCLELIRQARVAHIEPVGLISPAVFEKRLKMGIDLINISSGERQHLAVKRDNKSFNSHQQPQFMAKLDWLINMEVLKWGDQSLSDLPLTGDLLILDELGPLELLDSTGLTAGMDLIDRKGYKLTCVVIRPSLVQNALERWPWGEVVQVGRMHTSAIKI